MILHPDVKCKCGHPFSYHVSLPESDPEMPRSWPVRNCNFRHSKWIGDDKVPVYDYQCRCLDFTITFLTWLKETIK